jgi:hypothetical protein
VNGGVISTDNDNTTSNDNDHTEIDPATPFIYNHVALPYAKRHVSFMVKNTS